jgi:uncharacterized protein YbbC (DUF1343 family)
MLRNRRVGLVTNHTGRATDGQSSLNVLHALEVKVTALFSPEHGFSGTREGHIESGSYESLPIHSLYGDTRRPTAEMLDGIDVLVCDLQDVGARFYTYASTLAYCMEECAPLGIPVVVFDRPNPIGGETIEGPLIEPEYKSFVGHLEIPVRHGMTIGELALLHQAASKVDLEFQIAKVLGWQRDMLWPQTKLQWPVPSPNLPDWIAAAWYPGICLLEFSGVSVGRGTEAPFQIIGAPWMRPERVMDSMADWPESVREYFRAEPIEFTPMRGEHEGVSCRGLKFTCIEQIPGTVVPLGASLLGSFFHTHTEFNEEKLNKCLPLLGSSKVLSLIKNNAVNAAIEICERDATEFRAQRQPFLLY